MNCENRSCSSPVTGDDDVDDMFARETVDGVFAQKFYIYVLE